MGYKDRGAKLRVELIKGGTEVLISANRGGLLSSAEPESVPLEILLKVDL